MQYAAKPLVSNCICMNSNFQYSSLSSEIIRSFYKVYNELGYGFLEKVYERALLLDMREQGLHVVNQKRLNVRFRGRVIGEYYADLVVEDKVIVELKAAEFIHPSHEAQLVNYLRATDLEVGLLLNFGPKPTFKRRVLTSAFKSNHNRS